MTVKISFFLLSIILTLHTKEIMANTPTATEFNKQAAGFAVNLYKELIVGNENKNIIISPLSIHTALGLVYMGAESKTKSEIASVLRIPDSKSEASDRFRHVLCKYKNSTMLSIANKVYIAEGNELHPKFLEISKESFKSEAQNINFAANVDAAKTINTWVENQTNKKIQNLIEPSNLDVSTRMVLVNAIYFKGFWEYQFDKAATEKADFWTSETESIKVDMMKNSKRSLLYANLEDLDAAAVELPFKGEDLSMLIILPNKRTGLADLEAQLPSLDLPALRKRMHKEDVIVSMPKFKIEFKTELKDVLTKMGMPTAFSDEADFSGLLASPESLKISKVIHKAFIEVNEEGAEAAAATDIQFGVMSVFGGDDFSPLEVTVDHPFFLMVVSDTQWIFQGSLKSFMRNRE